MKLRFLLGAALAGSIALATACSTEGETECDEATAKLDDCNLPSVATFGATCEGVSLCEARCINTHSCEQIREAVVQLTPNDYSACDDACQ
ncbi:MAG: hypothetical protein D6689_06745 [Deltaproteobacteria bacterium]|nr:MAG: hypothetical protein D6689_06745 [Deltaproteobacteria bacterium]